MDPNEEFETLLAGVMDHSPDTVRNERLCELLRLFPALQNDYLDHLQIHAMLIWREGRVVQTPNLVSEPGKQLGIVEPDSRQSQRNNLRTTNRGSTHWVKAGALLCFGIGLGILLNLVWEPSADRENGPDLVEQLVGWNMDIAQAETKAERHAIYDTQAASLQVLMTNSKLSQEDRRLAQTLVDTGAWLTNNDDPMAEAERFSEIADVLLARIDSATVAKDNHRVTKLADAYRRLTEVGVSWNLERVIATGSPDPKRKPKLDHLIAGDARRAKKLEDLLERHPDASWKAIHRALKGHHRKLNTGPKQGN
jgi:hypothetical protein